MPLKHGPIEALRRMHTRRAYNEFSMPLKHGPIEAQPTQTGVVIPSVVFHAPKAWPH